MAGVEAKIERKACSILLSDYGIKSHKMRPFENGYPDRLYVLPYGVVVFVEYKAPGEEPTPLQADRIEELQKLGHHVYWFDNVEDAVAKVVSILQQTIKQRR